jgi:hypothetical protein
MTWRGNYISVHWLQLENRGDRELLVFFWCVCFDGLDRELLLLFWCGVDMLMSVLTCWSACEIVMVWCKMTLVIVCISFESDVGQFWNNVMWCYFDGMKWICVTMLMGASCGMKCLWAEWAEMSYVQNIGLKCVWITYGPKVVHCWNRPINK